MLKNALHFIALGCLLSSCGDSGSHGGGWFVFSQRPEGSLIGGADRQTYEFINFSSQRTRRGTFDPATVESLLALVNDDAVSHYAPSSSDEGRCHDVGYTLSTTQGAFCWIPQEVTDTQTRRMLDFMTALYVMQRDWAAVDAGPPTTTP
jgi:hypothetical protein